VLLEELGVYCFEVAVFKGTVQIAEMELNVVIKYSSVIGLRRVKMELVHVELLLRRDLRAVSVGAQNSVEGRLELSGVEFDSARVIALDEVMDSFRQVDIDIQCLGRHGTQLLRLENGLLY
jgi:hypothetical protein